MRLFERALRRAQIPVSMTKGFNPRPKLSFPLALQLGVEGLEEVLELELEEWITPDYFSEKLEKELPHGIEINQPEVIALNSKSKISSIVYKVVTEQPNTFCNIDTDQLLGHSAIIVDRVQGGEKKTIDIRPSIMSVSKVENSLIIHIKVTNNGTAKIREILDAFGLQTKKHLDSFKIIRTQVNIE